MSGISSEPLLAPFSFGAGLSVKSMLFGEEAQHGAGLEESSVLGKRKAANTQEDSSRNVRTPAETAPNAHSSFVSHDAAISSAHTQEQAHTSSLSTQEGTSDANSLPSTASSLPLHPSQAGSEATGATTAHSHGAPEMQAFKSEAEPMADVHRSHSREEKLSEAKKFFPFYKNDRHRTERPQSPPEERVQGGRERERERERDRGGRETREEHSPIPERKRTRPTHWDIREPTPDSDWIAEARKQTSPSRRYDRHSHRAAKGQPSGQKGGYRDQRQDQTDQRDYRAGHREEEWGRHAGYAHERARSPPQPNIYDVRPPNTYLHSHTPPAPPPFIPYEPRAQQPVYYQQPPPMAQPVVALAPTLAYVPAPLASLPLPPLPPPSLPSQPPPPPTGSRHERGSFRGYVAGGGAAGKTHDRPRDRPDQSVRPPQHHSGEGMMRVESGLVRGLLEGAAAQQPKFTPAPSSPPQSFPPPSLGAALAPTDLALLLGTEQGRALLALALQQEQQQQAQVVSQPSPSTSFQDPRFSSSSASSSTSFSYPLSFSSSSSSSSSSFRPFSPSATSSELPSVLSSLVGDFPRDLLERIYHVLSSDPTLCQIVLSLEKIQELKESDLAKRHSQLRAAHKATRDALLGSHRLGLKAVPAHQMHEAQMRNIDELKALERRFGEETESFMRTAASEREALVRQQQEALTQAGIPGFFSTTDLLVLREQGKLLGAILTVAREQAASSQRASSHHQQQPQVQQAQTLGPDAVRLLSQLPPDQLAALLAALQQQTQQASFRQPQ